MQLGIIADVHANLPALEAVLDDMPPVDQLVCLGDTVGYNPTTKSPDRTPINRWHRYRSRRCPQIDGTVQHG